jgi:hypothetical protein
LSFRVAAVKLIRPSIWRKSSRCRISVVDRLCASACANYIFLAAKRKIVLEGSVLLWHGMPTLRSGCFALKGYSGAARSDRLIEKSGMSFDLVLNPRFSGVPQDEQWSWNTTAWTYSPDALTKQFGVQGIVSMWYNKDEIKSRFASKHVFFPEDVSGSSVCDTYSRPEGSLE